VGFCCSSRLSGKPSEKKRSTLAEMHLRAAVHFALATGRLRSTDEVAVFGTHPYKRSSGLARGFPDSVPGGPCAATHDG
jgi:hypothetical protein